MTLHRIRRANTDWWINEKAAVGPDGRTYIVYITDTGEIHIRQIDTVNPGAVSRDFRLALINSSYSDEHDAPSMLILPDGRITVAYTGHGKQNVIRYRVTREPFDIYSFGPEKTLDYGEHRVTYAQISFNEKLGQIWLFTRVDGTNWEFRYSGDVAESWSEPVRFLETGTAGNKKLYYLNLRKAVLPSADGPCERWQFAMYGHPRSDDHVIRAGFFDSDGSLCRADRERTGFSLFSGDSIDRDALDTVFSAPGGQTVRLLEVSAILPFRVGFCTFEAGKPETITYYLSHYEKDGWVTSAPICRGGEFLSPVTQTDGSETYVGGMACYWGNGFAGLRTKKGSPVYAGEPMTSDRVFIARFDGNARVLESYVSSDYGRSYRLENTLRSIPEAEQIKIWRPTVPLYASDALPVYWHEGVYGGYAGGWHCDAVFFRD
ncbi:MAG: BNR-4 repeat-containing protein [Clostridia bacterium]|nr:BNR-4 repeat-containing protein [Clostridia bacterium]